MKIKDNEVIDEAGRTMCTFDPDTWERKYAEGVSQAQKMSIGRMLKPYKEGKKEFNSADQGEQTEESGIETKDWTKEENLPTPWEAFEDCPKPTGAGDKSETVVRWVHQFQPKFYGQYYLHRKTCIDVDAAFEKRAWEDKGAQFYTRGLKITDLPIGASASEKEHFEAGYKKYMLSELAAQENQDLGN